MKEPTELTGWKASDGKVFTDRFEAVIHEGDLAIKELCLAFVDKSSLDSYDPEESAQELYQWLERNRPTLQQIWYKQTVAKNRGIEPSGEGEDD